MKKKVNRIAALLASAALLFGALSCSSDSGGGGGSTPAKSTPTVAIVLTADPATVSVGETITVTSNIEGVKFSTSDSTIATVDESTGVVKGVKVGTATIRASKDAANGTTYTSGTVDIAVKAATTTYTIDGKTVVISDDGVSKTAAITETDGTETTATVTEPGDGTVTIVDSEGNTIYKASTNSDGTIDTSTVTDKDGNSVEAEEKTVLVTGITLNPATSQTIVAGETVQYTATVTPDDAADKSVTWSSSDETVATVDQTGLVKGVAAGTVEITATANDGSKVSKSSSVTVTATKLESVIETFNTESTVTPTTSVSGKWDLSVYNSESTSLPGGATYNKAYSSTSFPVALTDSAMGTQTGATLSIVDGSNIKWKNEGTYNYGLYTGAAKAATIDDSYKDKYSTSDYVMGKLALVLSDTADVTLQISGNGDINSYRWVVVTDSAETPAVLGAGYNLYRVEDNSDADSIKTLSLNKLPAGTYYIWMHGSRLNSVSVDNSEYVQEKGDEESLAGSIFTADFDEEDDDYKISIKDGLVISFTSATGGTLYGPTPADESLENWTYEEDSFTYAKSGTSVVITYSYTDEDDEGNETTVTEVLNGTLSSDGNTLSVISAEPEEDEEAVEMTKVSAVPEKPVATVTYYTATVVPVVDGTAGTGTEVKLAGLSEAVSTLVGTNTLIGTYSDSSYSTAVSLSDVKAGGTVYVVYITGNQYLSGSSKWDKVDFNFSSYSNISAISITLTGVNGKGTDSNDWWFNAVTWNEETSSNVYEVIKWSDEINGYTVTVTDADNIKAFSTYGLKITGNVFGSGNIEVTVTQKVPVTSVSVTGSDTTVKEGLTITLTATVLPENATDSTVTWASSDTGIATVSDGVVTGVKAGTAKITATADGATSDAYTVTVEANNATLTSIAKASDPTKTTYNVGDEIDLSGLSFTLTYNDGTTGTVSYSASAASSFAVSGFDSSSAASSKEVTVTYTVGEVKGTATFTVKIVQLVTGITVSGDSTVEVNSTITLKAAVEPTGATDSTVTWSSSDTSVATVSGGVVTGVAEGTAVITATANDGSEVSGSKTITVTAQTGEFEITIE